MDSKVYTKTTNRNLNIELARIIASFGVIAIHVHSSSKWAEYMSYIFIPLCVPYFFTTAMVFFVGSLDRYPLKNLLLKIWERIAIPFLSWTIIYLSFLYIRNVLTGKNHDILFWRAFFWGESAVQLYYLVTLIALQVFTISIFLVFKNKNKNDVYIGVLLLMITCIYVSFALYYRASGFRNIFYVLGFLVYIIYAFRYNNIPRIVNTKAWLPYLYLFFVLIFVGLYFFDVWGIRSKFAFFAPFCGISLFQFIVLMPIVKLSKWMLDIISFSYGVYLCHIVFLEFLEFFFKIYSGSELEFTLMVKLLFTIVVFFLSIFCVSILRRFSISRILLLGEK